MAGRGGWLVVGGWWLVVPHVQQKAQAHFLLLLRPLPAYWKVKVKVRDSGNVSGSVGLVGG